MRIGIIGTGRIASRFADTAFAGIESAYVSCVYNPKMKSAEKFAIQHRIENYTDNLEEIAILADAIYIASPHETHYQYAKYFLNNKNMCYVRNRQHFQKLRQKNCIHLQRKISWYSWKQ